tara:strand:- start:11084 stop:11866 length:783 start_codon:yes stop_codon:yes gene_type:complete
MMGIMAQVNYILERYFDLIGGFWKLFLEFSKEVFTKKIEFKLLQDQIYLVGLKSSVLVIVTAICSGLVLALQFGLGLEKFGGKLYVPKLVSLSFVRELGPAFTSLVIAGRVGAGYASEIGSMVVTQQIDAIRALGTSPMTKIVVPRVLALAISLPILTLIAIIGGLWASLILGNIELDLDTHFYYARIVQTLEFPDLMLAMVKTFVFAIMVSIPACYYGLNVNSGTRGVGIATTKAVVAGTILIFISNFVITKIFFMVIT